MSPTDDSPIVLIQVTHELAAESIVAELKRNGIAAIATGEFTAGFRAEAPGMVNVVVPRSQERAARNLLDTLLQDAAAVDWSTIDVGPPDESDT